MPPLHLPRLFSWILASFLLLFVVALLAPQQLPVSLYKLSLISTAAVAGYWLDRSIFPESRTSLLLTIWRDDPNNVMQSAIVLAAAMLRKALIIAAAMLAVSLGA